jgi:threonine synthase
MTDSMHAQAGRGDALATGTMVDDAHDVGAGVSTVTKRLECGCGAVYACEQMLTACPACQGKLRYTMTGRLSLPILDPAAPRSMWRYRDLLPIGPRADVVSLDEGGSEIIELPEVSPALGDARLFLKMDCVQNPTGTFKDREASLIISRCRALGLDRLVFYSTSNTGRAYMHYAASIGLTTYLFVPAECQYKQIASIGKGPANHLIAVDSEYPRIAPYAKAFAAANGLTLVAPLHDRTEAYATLAYEQAEQMPHCDFFAQTIASGMGPIGFLRGHEHLERLGARPPSGAPRIVCVQSGETNAMSRAYQAGTSTLTEADLPTAWPPQLFEPTLNSTNPVNNYPELVECLRTSNGMITDVPPAFVQAEAGTLMRALEHRGVTLAFDLEKSLLIGYAGLVRLANEGRFQRGDRILLLATGRGSSRTRELMTPDLVIRPSVDDPKDVFARLTSARV